MENPKYKELKGKVVAITGGGGVLCGTLAHAFADQGAKVCVMDLNMKSAEVVSEKIKNAGGSAIAVKVDVLDRKSLQVAKKEIAEKLGPCDILINGAGGTILWEQQVNPICSRKTWKGQQRILKHSLIWIWKGFNLCSI